MIFINHQYGLEKRMRESEMMKKKEKILILDDEVNMRRLLKVILSPYFEWAEAANGLEALDLLQKQ